MIKRPLLLRLFLIVLFGLLVVRPALAQEAPPKGPPPPLAPPRDATRPDDAAPRDPAADSKKSDADEGDDDDDDDSGVGNGDSPEPAKPVDLELMRFVLDDGMSISGKLSVKEIQVETEFGTLTIPIQRIRRFRPGLDRRPDELRALTKLIESLGDADQAKADAAAGELRNMGPGVREELERHLDDGGEVRIERIRKLLDQLYAQVDAFDNGEDSAPLIREDWIQTERFTVIGKITPESFQVNSQFGSLTVSLANIQTARRALSGSLPDVRRSFSIDGNYLAQLKYKNTGIRVRRGDKVSVQASGRINRSGSSSYVSGPDGSSRFGTFSQNPSIRGGALVARVGGGPVVQVGSRGSFIARRDGTLRFAIGMRPDYVGRYQFQGRYDLRVKVERGGK